MKSHLHHSTVASLLMLIFLLYTIFPAFAAHAASIGEIKDLIFDRNKKIEELEKEINQVERELKVVGKEKQTLQSAIGQLDLSRKKVSTDISLTQNKIGRADLTIGQLADEITRKESLIERNKAAMGETLRTMYAVESDSMLETILAQKNMSEVWDQVATIGQVQTAMSSATRELLALKIELEEKKGESEEQKKTLTRLKQELDGKKQVLDQNRKEKDQLLSATQSKEVTYQQMLAEKRAAYEQFQREINELEAQLQLAVDPESIPDSGQGVLGWPLQNLSVTQYFGNTPFAQSGAYNGNGHNGMDFRASVGTPVLASLTGVVQGTGNTDVGGCYSYGKWVLIKHSNGLSTLYAHLSVISVGTGQNVATSDIIGYSGNTGYSTGPHLHYTVYASDGVQLKNLRQWYEESGRPATSGCAKAGVTIPVADLRAYLNPLDYLVGADQLR